MKQQTLDQRLESYGVTVESKDTPSCKLFFTASAVAGMGAILVPPPAEAAIVYSGLQEGIEVKVVGDIVQTQTVDLDGDGNAEFTFDLFPPGFATTYYYSQIVSSSGNAAVIKDDRGIPERLTGNYSISSQKKFQTADGSDLANNYPGGYSGNFLNKQGCLGVRFEVSGNTYYGWIQYKTNENASIGTIIDWAYEDTPGKAIKAGAKKNFNWNLFLPAIISANKNK